MLKLLACQSLALAFVLSATGVSAGVSPQEASRLGKDLTPFGAEQAGNADGTIPAWTGGITTLPEGYKGGDQHHIDPFPNDQPLFTITKKNLDTYKANLAPGQIALFRSYPDTFQMPIYTTRRSGSAPQWVYENTQKNALTAKILNEGNGFTDAYGGIPFPIPKSGIEAVWNHIARYRGTYIVRRASEAVVQRNGSFSLVTAEQEGLFRYYMPDGNFASLNNILFYFMNVTKSPARLVGNSALIYETLDQVKEPRQAWLYSAGQRRVKRAPGIAYDMPVTTSGGLRTMDDGDMYNGAPDRYDWKLLGKREMYIPYNNYRISREGGLYKNLLQPGHLNPQLTRYELHRVWVVEGTLKSAERHIYSKRTLYLDEDSWQIAEVDQYDTRGELWRVSIAYLKNYYNLPTTWSAVDVFHDLQARRYNVMNLDSEESGTTDFNQPVPSDQYFKPSELRRRGTR
ncbi:DUF1329 domain-containing protein [Pseudomonas sp. CrR25]|nr:DUF1329 domain-containing protein [Pseudomonas sp. CrR25]